MFVQELLTHPNSCIPASVPICSKCKKEQDSNPDYTYMLSFLIESDGVYLPILVDGEGGKVLFSQDATNLYIDNNALEGIQEKMNKIKDKYCDWIIVSYQVKIEQQLQPRYKLLETTIE